MKNYITKVDNTAPAASGLLTAGEDNNRNDELKNLVTTAGLSLTDITVDPDPNEKMIAESVSRYASGAIFCQDSGGPNGYVLTLTGSFQPPTAYFTGMEVDFFPGNTSTGASQITAFGLGLKKFLRPDGSDIQSGDVVANKRTSARYDASLDAGNGAFKMSPWALPLNATIISGGGSGVVPLSGEGTSVDPGYHVNFNYPGLTEVTSLDPADLFAIYKNSAGHHRKITWANILAALGFGGGTVASAFLNVQVFRLSGTYTKTTGAKRALVFVTGGGGAGSGGMSLPASVGGGGAGGGAGETCLAFVDISGLTTVAVTVGAGGAANTSNNAGAGWSGQAGGLSSFGTYAKANGGAPAGVAHTNFPSFNFHSPGAGGQPQGGVTAGLIELPGGAGRYPGFYMQQFAFAGQGGQSFWSGGGIGVGAGPGAGGSGGPATGEAGGAGMVVVFEFS